MRVVALGNGSVSSLCSIRNFERDAATVTGDGQITRISINRLLKRERVLPAVSFDWLCFAVPLFPSFSFQPTSIAR